MIPSGWRQWSSYAVLLTAYCLLLTGCVRRTLTIRTDPPGAMVYVNDQLKGESPVSYDFVWYGWYRLMMRKQGYERLDDRQLLRAPVYLWIPLDFWAELLPFTIRDERTWSYTLTPTQEPARPQPPMTMGVAPTTAPQAPATPVESTTEAPDAAR